MKALFYIIIKSVKNSFKELLKSPGKIILYSFVIAMIIGLILITAFTRQSIETYSPIFWFTLIMFLFIAVFTVIAVFNGLSNGDAIFEMNDVNLLFVSPVNPRKILIYGVIKTAKTAFLAGFFILFQTSSLSNFGIGFDGVLIVFGCFILSIIVLTIVSLLIYSVSNGNVFRRRIVKIAAAAIVLPLVIFTIIQFIVTKDFFAALETAAASPLLKFIPVAGWTSSALTAFFSGEIASGFLFLSLNLLLGAGIITYIMLSNPDYYEDVLVATETAYEKKRALAEGDITAATVTKRKIKVTKTGIKGLGAGALFGKHMRESFRQNRFGFLNFTSVMFIIGAVIFSFIFSDIYVIFWVLMWSHVFLIGTGRGLRETYSHYIYMIPESSFKKIIWSNMEIMIKSFTEAFLVFTTCGIILKENPLHIFVFIITYTLFSFLLLGINYVFMRFTGANLSAGILIMIYFLAVVIAMAPGIVLAVVTGIAIGEAAEGNIGLIIGLLVLSLWELLAGIGCFTLSKGVLHDCDMPVYKPAK